jgi:hypothetical protein
MQRSTLIPTLIFIIVILSSCEELTESSSNRQEGDWLIPSSQVFDGGPGKDGIPSLDNPQFVTSPSYLSDEDLVLAVKIGDEIRAYPHPILDWHEIINDEFAGKKYSITYCPLTGSGISWNRVLNGTTTTFGVSGLLFNTNLIPYDRASNSNWSQMMLKSVNGSNIGQAIETYPLVETTWGTLKSMYSNVEVVSSSTGFNRSYERYPYGSYKTNNSLIFPVENEDSRLHKKERVIGIYENDLALAYTINSFEAEGEVVNRIFASKPIVVAGSQRFNYMAAYYRTNSKGEVLEFTELTDAFPAIMEDNKGNWYNIFGEAFRGPDKGEILGSPTSFIAYWFAWAAFYPGTELVQ